MTRLRRIALAIKSEDYSRRTPVPDSIRAHVDDEHAATDPVSASGEADAVVVADDAVGRDLNDGDGSARF